MRSSPDTAAERRANEIELDIRAGVHGWKSTIPSLAEWWAVYRKTYTAPIAIERHG